MYDKGYSFMTTHRALFLAFALALLGTPAFGQDTHGHDAATAAPHMGPATMNDFRSMMRTMMTDPVISKRMNELMASNPAFKQHVQRMRAMMSSGGGMMNGGGAMMNGGGAMMNGTDGPHGPMMSATPTPKP